MTDEEKWRKEAEEAFKFNPVYHSQHDFTLGYLAACRKRQKTIDLYYEATQACLNEGHFSENTKVKIKKALEAK